MGDVVDLKAKLREHLHPDARELVNLGDEIDHLVLKYVEKDLELFEVCGILSHRLGECIKNLPDPEHQADVFIDIILKKAGLSNG